MISVVGREYLKSNTESGEFSYRKAFTTAGKRIEDYTDEKWNRTYTTIDLRFANDELTVLVETKKNFDYESPEKVKEQLQAYVVYEKELTDNKIVAILANVDDDRLRVWHGDDLEITNEYLDKDQRKLKSFEEYSDLYFSVENNKIKVIQNTYDLNDKLHNYGINEKIRSQFVGTCLLALKNKLKYKKLSTKQILSGIEDILSKLLEKDLEKANKLLILKTKVLDSQDIRELESHALEDILEDIKKDILPYINHRSLKGQDLLNLFFTTFNKYVGKADKNQAFTPDHIVHFMCEAVGVNRHSKILDPCSGSGAFLVRGMTMALEDCATEKERERVKKEQIYGIEFEEVAYGLSTTNMLIHGDGNSNIKQGSCFNFGDEIEAANIDTVLMNPPYNAQRKQSDPEYVKTWPKSTNRDPSRGFHFVYYVASKVKKGRLAVLLPMSCAIGGQNKEINKYKEKMLNEHTLEAVFSFPSDMFYPGANVSVCCMIFDLGVRHEKARNKKTFFGYFKDDGFVKKKNLGRVEKLDENGKGVWQNIKKQWLELYNEKKEKKGMSVLKEVTYKDEWLAEAYMETDYDNLNDEDFKNKLKDFVAFEVLTGNTNFKYKENKKLKKVKLTDREWKEFYIDKKKYKEKGLFILDNPKGETTDMLVEGVEVPYIAAKKDINGLRDIVGKEGNEEFISKGNCIVFISLGEGSAGYSTYQPRDFIGMKGKIKLGYHKELNSCTGVFISTILDLERPKYSFGRSWTGNKLQDTIIKLPIDNEGNPDWDFMNDYMEFLYFEMFYK